MPGRRYGGFLIGDKYVRVSRRHQAQGDYGQISNVISFLMGLVLFLLALGAYLSVADLG
jgi:hypothetical protein